MGFQRRFIASAMLLAALSVLLGSAQASAATEKAQPGRLSSVKAGWLPQKHTTEKPSSLAPSASATSSVPFTECPAVGFDTSCGLLVDVTDSGVSILQDPSQGPYDGSDDTLVGVLNQSSKTLGHLSLSADTDIFGFDGDGICSGFSGTIEGCPFGPTGYEGPGTSFIEISPDLTSGVVSFAGGVSPGGTAYFSLEEPLTSSTIVSGGPSPTEQGGAPNRSEHRSTCGAGRPVNCATGVFWHEFTDAKIPGRGVPLELTRTYSSMNAETDGPLGFGWTDSYNMSLSIDSETGAATIQEEGGSAVTFPSNGEGGFTTPPRVLATLTANEDGTYTFSRYADHIRYDFSGSGQLLQEVDRNGNVTALSYSGGQLEQVTDPSGRSLTFTYTGSRVHSVIDPMGRTTTFSYDAGGNLTEATDPMGRTWAFTYDSEHRLLTMTDPRGGTTTNIYDSSGRVVSQVDPAGRELTWVYEGDPTSSEGGITTLTDARGDKTVYDYRDLELMSITHGADTADEATTSYSYDPTTLGVKTVTDPDGHETHNRYDSHGNLIESYDPMGRTSYYSYGSMDELIFATDPRGNTTAYIYDGAGNLFEKEAFLSGTGEVARTTYSYDGAPGEITAVSDPDGHITKFSYDNAGDRIGVIDADGNETTYSYNADGQLASAVSPAGNEAGGDPAAHTTTYVYNTDGELTSEADQLGHTTSYTYDGNGNRTSVTDANGHTTHQSYDADDELTEVIRPDGSVLKTQWDAAGNMVGQVDAAGHTTSYSYDHLDRLTSVTDPDGHSTTYAYDPAGNKTESVNAEGQAVYYGYDADGELTSTNYSDGSTPSVYQYYDEDGNRTFLEDGTGTSSFTYDSLNRLTSATDGNGTTVNYEYDLASNLTKLTYPNGQSVTRSYDPANNLKSVTDWLGHTTHFSYNAESDLSEQIDPNGVTARFGYDNADRLSSIADSNGASQLASFNYTRDPIDQVTNETTKNGESSNVSYGRNTLDQLTSANASPYDYDAADNPTTFGAETTQHFDPANELISVTGPGEEEKEEEEAPGTGGGGAAVGGGSTPLNSGATPPPTPTPRKTFRCHKGFRGKRVHGKRKCVRAKKKRHAHSNHRAYRSAQTASAVGSAGPSDAGRASAGPSSRSSSGPQRRTSQDRQLAVSVSTEVTRDFTYNARGDRISEELLDGSTRILTYDQADRLIGVNGNVSYSYNGDGLRTSKAVNGVPTDFVWNQTEPLPELLQDGSAYYIYGPEGKPIEQIEGATATYLHEDQQGSVRLLTGEAGSVIGSYDYTPWGNVSGHTGSATSNLQFDGQYTDAETGYQYLRARYYDPATGQFLTPDPIYPITQSRFGYAANNPQDFSDPLGLWGLPSFKSVFQGALNIAAAITYAPYYASYETAHAINSVGARFGVVGSVVSHVLAVPFAPVEAAGLGGDVLIDWVKGHTVDNESICDEGKIGYINPLHSFLPNPFKGPQVYLPGIHGNGEVDFEW